ncbi:uncharacterized protein BKA78DRAFT_327130, partial [Phyllosticta capitalensis]|uniref:uncharacterized protein n=1 Tax=Phyllosticta capitalensis TaxID=121624 RepID=UPI0031328062
MLFSQSTIGASEPSVDITRWTASVLPSAAMSCSSWKANSTAESGASCERLDAADAPFRCQNLDFPSSLRVIWRTFRDFCCSPSFGLRIGKGPWHTTTAAPSLLNEVSKRSNLPTTLSEDLESVEFYTHKALQSFLSARFTSCPSGRCVPDLCYLLRIMGALRALRRRQTMNAAEGNAAGILRAFSRLLLPAEQVAFMAV